VVDTRGHHAQIKRARWLHYCLVTTECHVMHILDQAPVTGAKLINVISQVCELNVHVSRICSNELTRKVYSNFVGCLLGAG